MEEIETETMEPENSGGGLGALHFILIILCVVGVALGGTGIYLSLDAKKQIDAFRQEVKSRPDKTVDIQKQIDSLEERLINVGSETVRAKSLATSIRDETQRAFDTVSRELKTNRDQINKTNEQVGALANRILTGPAPAPAPKSTGTTSTSSASTPTAEAPEDGYHVIVSGDTLGKLAQAYGTTVDAIMRANPGVDPRRLQLGQKIKIPE